MCPLHHHLLIHGCCCIPPGQSHKNHHDEHRWRHPGLLDRCDTHQGRVCVWPTVRLRLRESERSAVQDLASTAGLKHYQWWRFARLLISLDVCCSFWVQLAFLITHHYSREYRCQHPWPECPCRVWRFNPAKRCCYNDDKCLFVLKTRGGGRW